MNNTMQLYNYQLAIIEKSRMEFARHKRVCVSLPTGAGKSVVAARIIQLMLEKNPRSKVWFCVPRLELIPQMRRTLARFNIFCGEISAKTKDFLNAVCVCSKDTIMRLTSTPTPDVVFFDEAHVAIEQQRAIADRFPHAYIIGLTATPEIADGRPMLFTNQPNGKTLGLYQALVISHSIPELQRLGALAGLDYKSISETDAEKFGLLDTGLVEVGQAIDTVLCYGDVVQEYEKYGAGKPAIGFAPTIAIADKCVAMLNAAGHNWRRISGDMPFKKRQVLIDALVNRRIDGLVNAMLLTYGFDAPCVEYAFSVRYVRSRTLWVQMVGRCLRAYTGKQKAVFVDHTGCCYHFKEQNKPFLFDDENPKWHFAGKNLCRCQFKMEDLCTHKTKRKKPHCLWDVTRACNAPLYYFRDPSCKPGNTACSEIIKLTEHEQRARELQQINAKVISVNLHTQIKAALEKGILTEGQAVERLIAYSDLMGYHPLWVYYFINKGKQEINYETLTLIARVKGYKQGWVAYEARRIQEKTREL
jgi:superfamily II DNA or RNA helicase